MFCFNCGKNVGDNENFCSKCGVRLQGEIYHRNCVGEQNLVQVIQPNNNFHNQNRSNGIFCKKCGSNNVSVQFKEVSETIAGRNEVRKKSIVTRTGNKLGRAGMIMATGGLWALTPKKSKYNEVQKGKIKAKQIKVVICQNCGNSWNL